MRVRVVVVTLVIATTLTVVLAAQFRHAFTWSPGITTKCTNEYGQIIGHAMDKPVTKPFDECVRKRVANFLEHDYPESKDLAKSFLTLLTAVLVASITFSEKIVDFARASWVSKSLIITCWLSVLGAITACGVGLAFMAQAAGWATYQPFLDDRSIEDRAVGLFITAGLAFGVGLATLITAGIISLVGRSSRTKHQADAAL
jgi:hypothetical protein